MTQRTVLVVEDDAMIRGLIAELLDEAGYAVLEASSGRAGLQAARDHTPSVVLVDQMLPDMSGLDVLEGLRQDDTSRHIPVMLVSGRTDQLVGRDHGADRVLAKPFEINVLLEHVAYLANNPHLRVRQRSTSRFRPVLPSCALMSAREIVS
jgi:two-component system phosphate regulon response regulator PhoB